MVFHVYGTKAVRYGEHSQNIQEITLHSVSLVTIKLACVADAWKWWAKEKTGAREIHACLLLARPFFLMPTTSRGLLRPLLPSACYAGYKQVESYLFISS